MAAEPESGLAATYLASPQPHQSLAAEEYRVQGSNGNTGLNSPNALAQGKAGEARSLDRTASCGLAALTKLCPYVLRSGTRWSYGL